MKTEEKQVDSWISDLVGALTDPIIVYPGGWGDSLPEWLRSAITLERLIENVRALKEGEMTATDAEVCAYLMTASLTFPFDRDWTEIYLYVAGKVCRQHKQAEIPGDILVESLRDDQMRNLNQLKRWIYERRVRYRKEKESDTRRQEREKREEAKEKVVQYTFDFSQAK